MALALADRLLTIAVTATVTSAAWIAASGTMFQAQIPGSADREAPPAGVTTEPAIESGNLIVPVQGVNPGELIDTFGEARGSGERMHGALDIMAPAGTPVIAAAGGTVEKLFQSEEGGLTIYVRTPDRATIYYYAHLQGYAAGLHEGQRVRQGERLGTVGSSGNADPSTPHLHFAVLRTSPQARWWDDATPLNPFGLLTAP